MRIAETDVGMLNSIGLANPGQRARFWPRRCPACAELGVPLWVSVGGFCADEYAETCARLEDVTIELNLSCPNVDEAPESAAEIVAACRAATALPLYAKLSPASWDIGELARAVEAAGADGLSLVNTLRGMELDPELRPVLGTADRRALRAGAQAGRARRRPRLLPGDRAADRRHGRGRTGRDALELLAAGARAVALGTVLVLRPGRSGPDPRRIVGRTGNARALVGRAGVRDCPRRSVASKKTPRCRVESF